VRQNGSAYLGNGSGARHVLGFDAVVLAFHQIVGALAHEVKMTPVERRVVRVAQSGATGAALLLAAPPLTRLASAVKIFQSNRHVNKRAETLHNFSFLLSFFLLIFIFKYFDILFQKARSEWRYSN